MKTSTPRYVEMIIAKYRSVLKKCWMLNVVTHASVVGMATLGVALLAPTEATAAVQLNETTYSEKQIINISGKIDAIAIVSKDTQEVNTSAKPSNINENSVINSDAIVVNMNNIDNSEASFSNYYGVDAGGAAPKIYGNIITNLNSTTHVSGAESADPEFVGTAYSGSSPIVYGNSVVNMGVLGSNNANLTFGTGNVIASGAGTVNGSSQVNVNSGQINAESLVGGAAWGGVVKGNGSVNIYGGEINLATDKPDRRGVYGGSYAAVNGNSVVKGDTSVNIYGGTVTGAVYGGGYGGSDANKAITEGNSSVNITGASTMVNGDVFGGGNNFAEVKGNSSVSLTDAVVNGYIYGGGLNSSVAGNVVVDLFSGSVARIYGAGIDKAGTLITIGGDVYLNASNAAKVNRIGALSVDGGLATINGKIVINSDADLMDPLYGAGQAWYGGSIEVKNGVEINITGGRVGGDGIMGGGFVRTDDDATKVEANPGHVTISGGTKINISGGDISAVYGGTHTYSLSGKLIVTSNISGGTSVTITGGEIGKVFGGGYNAWGSRSVIDTTSVDITNTKVAGFIVGGSYVVGGGMDAGSLNHSMITGNTKVKITDSKADSVAGGGLATLVVGTGISHVGGSTSVAMTNSIAGDVIGGGVAKTASGDAASTTIKSTVNGDTMVVVDGGEITSNVLGGGAAFDYYGRKTKLIVDVGGNTVVKLSNVKVKSNIIGGGALINSVNSGSSANVGGSTLLDLKNVQALDNVFGGGFSTENSTGSNVVSGSTTVNVLGGEYAKAIAGGGWYSNVNGSTKVSVKDAVVHSGVIGGGVYGTSSTGDTDVYVGGSTKIDGAGSGWGSVIGGGQGMGTSTGNTNVVVEGDSEISGAWTDAGGDGKNHGYVFGGGWGSTTNGNTSVLVQGNAKVATWVIGGGTCNDAYDSDYGLVTGNTSVTIGGNAIIGNGDVGSKGTNGYVVGGGWAQDVTGISSVTLKDNAVVERSIYAGGFQSSVGGTRVLIAGGTVGSADKIYSDVVGGGYAGDVKGNTHVEVSGGKIYGSVYGGGSGGGNVTGDTTIIISGGTIGGGVYAGAQDGGTVGGKSTISIFGATVSGDIIGLGSDKNSTLNFATAGNYSGAIKNFSSAVVGNNNVFSGSVSNVADAGLKFTNEKNGSVSGSIFGTNMAIYDHGTSGAWNNATITSGATGTMYSSLSSTQLAEAYAQVNGFGTTLVVGGDGVANVKLVGATVVENSSIDGGVALDNLSDGNNNVTFSNDVVINNSQTGTASEITMASNMTTMQNITSNCDAGLVINDVAGASSSIESVASAGDLKVNGLQETSKVGALSSEKSVVIDSNAGTLGNISAKEDVMIGFADSTTADEAKANTGAVGNITGNNVYVNNAAGADKGFGNIIANNEVKLNNSQAGYIGGSIIVGTEVSLANDGHFAGIISADKFIVTKNTSANTLVAVVQNASEITATNNTNGVAEITNQSDHLSTLNLTQTAGASNTFKFINDGTINTDVTFLGTTTNTQYIATNGSVTNSSAVSAGSVTFQSGSTLTSDGSTVITADSLTVEDGAKLDYTGVNTTGNLLVSVSDALQADQLLNFSLPALIRAIIDGTGLRIVGMGNFANSINTDLQGVGLQMDGGGFDSFDSLTQAELDSLGYRLSPDIYTVLPKVIFDGSRSTYTNILRNNLRLRDGIEQRRAGNGTGEALDHDWNFFLTAHGTYTNEHSRGVRSGYSATGSNYTLGATKYFGENAMFGLALDYGNTKVNMSRDAGIDAKINSLRPIMFVGVTSESGFDFDAAVGYGYHDSSVHRNFELGSGVAYNKESFDTNEVSAMVNLGYKLKLTDKIILEPVAGVYFGYLHNGSVRETSTNPLSRIDADSSDSWSLQSSLGARLYYTLDITESISITPEFYALWQHEFGDRSFDRTFSLNGNAFSSSYSGIRYGRDNANIGVRLSTELGKAWTVSAEYSAILGQNSFGNNFGLSVNYSF